MVVSIVKSSGAAGSITVSEFWIGSSVGFGLAAFEGGTQAIEDDGNLLAVALVENVIQQGRLAGAKIAWAFGSVRFHCLVGMDGRGSSARKLEAGNG